MLEDGTQFFQFIGEWKLPEVARTSTEILNILKKSKLDSRAVVDLSEITKIDTVGAALIARLQEQYKGKIELQGLNEHAKQLISIIPKGLGNDLKDNYPKSTTVYKKLENFHTFIGKKIVLSIDSFLDHMNILGLTINSIYELIIGKSRSKEFISDTVKHINYVGVEAAPVIILISFVTGAVIAQQGAFQLGNFGAEIFVVDSVSILQLREIGVLLTAIMIAGRSGSAIAAEIGAMKINEEIDAIKVMGMDVVRTIISPRICALVISLPLLTILADFSSIMAASIIVWKYSHISFFVFFSHLNSSSTLLNIVAGLLKSPIMACAIGVIALKEGLRAGFDANSIGNRVTTCVVRSISVVITIDSIFAIFYFAIGI
ncbi:MAG: ABC transporter [Candidatus Liberibacter europaeus]|uniref:ABC transporter n=1 Tax=Candidatus Liberibacter europaeus TaxID=744859 RepID=A0A2T4VYM0_9HYPH|nr:ABC transporter [Candidatus Liberibacter europaeus]PTL86851.1 MAG: ABC transporter [Candidatus Liberibacter europaeus]